MYYKEWHFEGKEEHCDFKLFQMLKADISGTLTERSKHCVYMYR